jgi:hypothetical protein
MMETNVSETEKVPPVKWDHSSISHGAGMEGGQYPKSTHRVGADELQRDGHWALNDWIFHLRWRAKARTTRAFLVNKFYKSAFRDTHSGSGHR